MIKIQPRSDRRHDITCALRASVCTATHPVPYRKLVNDTPELDFRTTVPTPPDIPAAFTESMVIPVF
eukprot:CAMPEP_0114235922 /NCGR_PEP_ID=MMETSP0058-20121206/6522_1 /TAXON_ID=36894 /ORGANISM="Pyramimonas parkeae, CCMP726" /LENGTH=66 /DNA_ID=CAMNT_0001347743 /DNA_START=181 /DNA_END=381 /DNA_ORIENTATION=+